MSKTVNSNTNDDIKLQNSQQEPEMIGIFPNLKNMIYDMANAVVNVIMPKQEDTVQLIDTPQNSSSTVSAPAEKSGGSQAKRPIGENITAEPVEKATGNIRSTPKTR